MSTIKSPSREPQGHTDLDLSEGLLRGWKQALAAEGDRAFPGHGDVPALEEELRRLRAEDERIQMERDILGPVDKS